MSRIEFVLGLREYVSSIESDIQSVSGQRRAILDQAVAFIGASPEKSAALNFICTHNSRRSHLSHVWAHVAAIHCGLDSVRTFSGGTEATACNERTVAAFERAGFAVAIESQGSNPIYGLVFSAAHAPIRVYSKVYSDPPNPPNGYAAMMCCSDVDERCPVVQGATARIPLHYLDPKVSDGTDSEAATYDERCREIAVEMFYLMKTAADVVVS